MIFSIFQTKAKSHLPVVVGGAEHPAEVDDSARFVDARRYSCCDVWDRIRRRRKDDESKFTKAEIQGGVVDEAVIVAASVEGVGVAPQSEQKGGEEEKPRSKLGNSHLFANENACASAMNLTSLESFQRVPGDYIKQTKPQSPIICRYITKSTRATFHCSSQCSRTCLEVEARRWFGRMRPLHHRFFEPRSAHR